MHPDISALMIHDVVGHFDVVGDKQFRITSQHIADNLLSARFRFLFNSRSIYTTITFNWLNYTCRYYQETIG